MLTETDQGHSGSILECNLDQLEKLKAAAKNVLKFSDLYLPMLRGLSNPRDSEKNQHKWCTVKEGSYYLGNVDHLVRTYKECVPGPIRNDSIKSVSDLLIYFEFDDDHISSGFTDEAYGGKVECFVSKGQGTRYYELLHSEWKEGTRSFVKLVESKIDIPVKKFLELVEERLHAIPPKNILSAAKNNNILEVKDLIKKGAIVTLKDTYGRTSLHYAVDNGNIHMVKSLLENGAEVTHTTDKGNSPLHLASSKGYTEVLDILLQNVPSDKMLDVIDARTTSGGTTALHVAAQNGFLEIVLALLKHGATFNIENKEGKTPLDLAKDEEVVHILKLLEELFVTTSNGDAHIINKLRLLKEDEFSAVTGARKVQKNTLLQVASLNEGADIRDELAKMLKIKEIKDNKSSILDLDSDQLKRLKSAAELVLFFFQTSTYLLCGPIQILVAQKKIRVHGRLSKKVLII